MISAGAKMSLRSILERQTFQKAIGATVPVVVARFRGGGHSICGQCAGDGATEFVVGRSDAALAPVNPLAFWPEDIEWSALRKGCNRKPAG